MLRTLIGIFLILHGLVHSGLAAMQQTGLLDWRFRYEKQIFFFHRPDIRPMANRMYISKICIRPGS